MCLLRDDRKTIQRKMIKYVQVYSLFLMLVCHISCGQHQTNVPKDNINYDVKDTVTSYGPDRMVRNVKQDRNGNILIASLNGIFRYDGKSFTNLTSSKIGSRIFWDVLEDRRGNLWLATRDSGVYNYNGKTFQHFTTQQGLASNQASVIFMKTKSVIFGSVPTVE